MEEYDIKKKITNLEKRIESLEKKIDLLEITDMKKKKSTSSANGML